MHIACTHMQTCTALNTCEPNYVLTQNLVTMTLKGLLSNTRGRDGTSGHRDTCLAGRQGRPGSGGKYPPARQALQRVAPHSHYRGTQ
jgi:hypothetical protein